MEELNPKDYPFNYLCEFFGADPEGNAGVRTTVTTIACSTYPEALENLDGMIIACDEWDSSPFGEDTKLFFTRSAMEEYQRRLSEGADPYECSLECCSGAVERRRDAYQEALNESFSEAMSHYSFPFPCDECGASLTLSEIESRHCWTCDYRF